MTTSGNAEQARLPVLIVGAGPSGLLLAQVLRRHNIPFRLFERDEDFTTRGIGWGLTLNWSLPVLRELLPDDLGSVDSMRGISVDRVSVEAGVACRFPFFDLATGERCMSAPAMPESKVMRVTRKDLRRMLATDIPVEFNKSFKSAEDAGDSVTVSFEDGTSVRGSLLVGCDGGKSRVRRHLAPELSRDLMYEIPIRLVGLRVEYTAEEMAAIQELDPFFFHATSSTHGTFIYMGVLDAPKNNKQSTDKYCVQYCISWPFREGVLGRPEPIEIPASNAERLELVNEMASTWAEPFRSLVTNLPAGTELTGLVLNDWLPPLDFQTSGRCTLMGDALHMMSMYRGEGVSHALEDVKEFFTHVLPCLDGQHDSNSSALRDALSIYESEVVRRVRPGVLASRQAAIDAHRLGKVPMDSPVLTRRQRNVPFPDPMQS